MLLVSKSTRTSSDDPLAAIVQRLDTLQTSNEQLRELNNKLVQKSAGWGTSITNLNSTVDKLKASNSKLEKELAKERDDRKAESDRLEERLAEERDDRKAERERFEERLEKQDQSHTARLAEEKAARIRDMQSITEVRAPRKHCSHYRPSFLA